MQIHQLGTLETGPEEHKSQIWLSMVQVVTPKKDADLYRFDPCGVVQIVQAILDVFQGLFPK